MIPLVVNGKVTSALIGRNYSIISEEKAKEFGKVNTARQQPALQGVTGSPLRLLASIQLDIEIVTEGTVKHWGGRGSQKLSFHRYPIRVRHP